MNEFRELERQLDSAVNGEGDSSRAKVLADLFARNDVSLPSDLRTRFGDVMAHLLQEADEGIWLYAAERIAHTKTAPAFLIDQIIDKGAPVSLPIITRFTDLPPQKLSEAIAGFDDRVMSAAAARNDLTGQQIDLLIACGTGCVIETLVAENESRLDDEQRRQIALRDDLSADTARRLIPDAPSGKLDHADLFWSLEPMDRHKFIDSLPQTNPPTMDELPRFRSNKLEPQMAEGLIYLARHGAEEDVIAGLSRITGSERSLAERAYCDATGEALCVLVRASGLGERALCSLLLLNSNLMGMSSDRVRELAHLHNHMPRQAAQMLLHRWAHPAPMAVEDPAIEVDDTDIAPQADSTRQATHDPAVTRPGAERRSGEFRSVRKIVLGQKPRRVENTG